MNSNRDNFFRSLLNADMVDEWDGDMEAPTGYFGHITICNIDEAEELHSSLYGCAPTYLDKKEMAETCVGSFVMLVNSQGITYVTRYSTIKEKLDAYAELMAQYLEWANIDA